VTRHLVVIGMDVRVDPDMDPDEVRIETPNPAHWVTLNVRTGEGVVVNDGQAEPFELRRP